MSTLSSIKPNGMTQNMEANGERGTPVWGGLWNAGWGRFRSTSLASKDKDCQVAVGRGLWLLEYPSCSYTTLAGRWSSEGPLESAPEPLVGVLWHSIWGWILAGEEEEWDEVCEPRRKREGRCKKGGESWHTCVLCQDALSKPPAPPFPLMSHEWRAFAEVGGGVPPVNSGPGRSLLSLPTETTRVLPHLWLSADGWRCGRQEEGTSPLSGLSEHSSPQLSLQTAFIYLRETTKWQRS